MAGQQPLKRKYYCGRLNEEHVGATIQVYGWVNNKRELGGVTFLDLRDREGILQIVFNEAFADKATVKKLGREFVIAVKGTVVKRSNPNPELPSGAVELIAESLTVLNSAENPPFLPEKRSEVSEEIRFKYRYIDLRSQELQKNFRLRSRISLKIRNFLDNHGFLDLETPMLAKATPEGARDYLVPSRVYKGKMFALPQSPQLFKQLFMISGFERYYQIVKCFRDEDLRADRQPEFTQVDIEMSFAESRELFDIIEDMIRAVFSGPGKQISDFRRISYTEAMEKYGSDKPDLRIPIEIADLSESARKLDSTLLNGILDQGGTVRAITMPDADSYSRKKLDLISDTVKEAGGQGVIWLRHAAEGYKSSLKLAPERIEALYRENGVERTQIIFLIAGETRASLFLAGRLREHLGSSFRDPNRLEFAWVTDFPLFFFNGDQDRLDSNHHPFTAPRNEDLAKLDTAPLDVKSEAYDLVLNGVEIGGGSRRINDIQLQRKIFRLLHLSEREIDEKFSFFLDALRYGAPPHLGIALGFDRLIMLLAGEQSIREIIAFPKTTSSLCLLTGSPSTVSAGQLKELGIEIKK